MNNKRVLSILCAFMGSGVAVFTVFHSSTDTRAGSLVYSGLCDASAVEVIDASLFVVASDEDNVLRVYDRVKGGMPVQVLHLSTFLGVDPQEPESDLEGAARLGERVYWITSHGRNAKCLQRVSRHRFFATTAVVRNGMLHFQSVGRPYGGLLDDLRRDPRLRPFDLNAASERAPKTSGALNIEGLTATPEGHLWIGFRNPIPRGRALLVPLLNPADVVTGQTPQFGEPQLLDLGGLGIRSLTFWQGHYLIVAGAHDGTDRSRLYHWRGARDTPQPIDSRVLEGLNPEGIATCPMPAGEELLVVSDDGTRSVNGKPCKKLKDPRLKSFRAVMLTLDGTVSQAVTAAQLPSGDPSIP